VNTACMLHQNINALVQKFFVTRSFSDGLLFTDTAVKSSLSWKVEQLRRVCASLAFRNYRCRDPTEFALSHKGLNRTLIFT
jgi:hypothetical protein